MGGPDGTPDDVSASHGYFGPKGSKAHLPPLLLHFDVNKTIIISDMAMNKSVEYTIREVIANQFWGHVEPNADTPQQNIWVWDGRGASVSAHQGASAAATTPRGLSPDPVRGNSNQSLPPSTPKSTSSRQNGGSGTPFSNEKHKLLESEDTDHPMVSYLCFCRKSSKDKNQARLATRSFDLAHDPVCKNQMNEVTELAVKSMVIPEKMRTEELVEQCGLEGEWRLIFPSFFRFVAHLQHSGRRFSVFFRSFGVDLPRIRIEWNAFCECKHPLYKDYLDGIGAMDGTVEGIPDRRLQPEDIHTMFRDADGAMLAMHVMTNGAWEGEWDQWARSQNDEDTRHGREFFRKESIRTLQGYASIQAWMKQQLKRGRSHCIRDDFAWWHWNKEKCSAGKLLIGLKDVQQVFFDDNVGDTDLRIVDCRRAGTFDPVPSTECIGTVAIRVDTLSAMLDDDYFSKELDGASQACNSKGHPLWVARSPPTSNFQSNLSVDCDRDEDDQDNLSADEEEESPPRVQNSEAIEVGDSVEKLSEFLEEEGVDIEKFGAPGTTYKNVEALYQELTEGKCFLKMQEVDGVEQVIRVLEVVRVKLVCNNLILCESHEQLPDGRLRSRNGYLPATKKKQNEDLHQAVTRWSVEELQLKLSEAQIHEAVQSVNEWSEVTSETMSFPLPCSMNYREVCLQLIPDKLEQELLNRLGLPAGTMFSTTGLQKKKGGTAKAKKRSFWSWYKIEVWEAMQKTEKVEVPDIQEGMAILFHNNTRRKGYELLLLQMFDCFSANKLCGGMSGSLVLQVQPVDPIDGRNQEPVIVKLDKADVVSREIVNSKRVGNVLSDRAARIIGDGCFVTDDSRVEYGAFKIELAGGCWQVPELAGGSKAKDLLSTFKDLFVVESERQLLNEQMIESLFLPVHGDVEVVLRELLGPGGMLRVLRREGLARNPLNLFNSYFYAGKDTRWNPFFKPGHFQYEPLRDLWRRSFGLTGTPEMPNVRDQVRDLVEEFRRLEVEKAPIGQYKPIIGLAHGDLNAMNILIDVMDAVWLIDFAFSEEKPMCWDLTKVEIAFMFEYAVLPVCWRTLLAFAGDTEEEWKERKVFAWLGVSEKTIIELLKELQALENAQAQETEADEQNQRALLDRMAAAGKAHRKRVSISTLELQEKVSSAIHRACNAAYPDCRDKAAQKKKDTEVCRLHAGLLASEAEEERALAVTVAVTDAMLHGRDLTSCMQPPVLNEIAQEPEGASLVWCWGKCTRLRSYFVEEWQTLQKVLARKLGQLKKADESPLLFWLGLLQESYRLLGYFDVAPWTKAWVVHFLEKLVSRIREFVNPPDALEKLSVSEGWRRESLSREHFVLPPPFPERSQFILRGKALQLSTSAPFPESTQLRVRAAHRSTGEIADLSGPFAEVAGILEVTMGGKKLAHRQATRDISGGPDIHSLEFDGVTVGFVQCADYETEAVVQLSMTVVPVPATVLSGQLDTVDIEAETNDGKTIVVVVRLSEQVVFCYPAGARIFLAAGGSTPPIRPGMRLCHATVGQLSEQSGAYEIRWDNQSGAGATSEANLVQNNHLQASSYEYSPGARLAVYREPKGFVDVVVVSKDDDEDETTSAQHLVRIEKEHDDDADKEDEVQERQWLVDLNGFNHAPRGHISAEDAAEELRRYRLFIKAKHSLLYTVTSERTDCLEGPVPRVLDSLGRELCWPAVLAMVSETYFVLEHSVDVFADLQAKLRATGASAEHLVVTDNAGEVVELPSSAEDVPEPDRFPLTFKPKYGERNRSHIFRQGVLFVGQAGSGKSCLICKLLMHCVNWSKMLVPIFIPVADLVACLLKAEQAQVPASPSSVHSPKFDSYGTADLAHDDGEALINWYLRRAYGDDTNRYFMLQQALQCHRTMIFFDGVDEAGTMRGRVERCMTALVAQDHCCIATARLASEPAGPKTPRVPARDHQRSLRPRWLRTAPDLFQVVELLPLEQTCRSCLVEVLLSRDTELKDDDTKQANKFCESFYRSLQEDERRKWSTPLMLSVLVASWREKRRQDLQLKQSNAWQKRGVRRSTMFLDESASMSLQGSMAMSRNQQPSLGRVLSGEMVGNTPSADGVLEDPESTKVDIRGVYNVALDLLLRRFQSRQQADRHKMKETVEKFKRLLQIIASRMTELGSTEFGDDEVLPLVDDDFRQVWRDLADATREGRCPLLHCCDTEKQHSRFEFAYQSFQSYLNGGRATHEGFVVPTPKTPFVGTSPRQEQGRFLLIGSPRGDARPKGSLLSPVTSPRGALASPAAPQSPRMPSLPLLDEQQRRSSYEQENDNNINIISYNGHLTRKSEVAGEVLDLAQDIAAWSCDRTMPERPQLQLKEPVTSTAWRRASMYDLPPPPTLHDFGPLAPAPSECPRPAPMQSQ